MSEAETGLNTRGAELLLAKDSLHALLEAMPVGIWRLDAAGRTAFGNARLRRLFAGVAPIGLAGAGLELVGLPDPAGIFGFTPGQEHEAILRRPGLPPLRLLVAATLLTGPEGGCLLSMLDITAQRAAEARVEHLAEHDALTGLANRAALTPALEAIAEVQRGGALLLIDLDHLKSANERHGQAAGDALLREAARRLREVTRPTDLVARLGSDEFAVVAFGLGAPAAQSMAERIREAMAGPLRYEGPGGGCLELPAAVTIGIACAPEHGTMADTLLRAADLAKYEAKAQGRDAARLFHPALRQRSEQRAQLREAFSAALRDDELELHVQPQRHSETRVLMGAEALIRWQSTRLGRWVPPDELLAAAAEAGLLQDLDRWVLRRAIALQRVWQDQPGAPPHLGLNITIATLHEPHFAQEVAAALAASGLRPEQLEIEIPEDLALRDLPGVARTLAALREVGVSLALDDFGGGHSGLPHVVRLPVQRLKLDRSIVCNLPDDAKSYAVLRATMALARGMGIEVIAEGVETEAQAAALRRVGCPVIQGWLIGKAMPPQQLLSEVALRAAM